MIFKRALVLTFSGLVILTSMASCSLPGFNSDDDTSLTLGVLKKDPTATYVNENGNTVPFDKFGKVNRVKNEQGQDIVDGLENISVHKIEQTDYNKFFILTEEKGIFQTTDGGRNWERRYVLDNDDFATKVAVNDGLNITAMEIDDDNNILYVATREGESNGIHMSRDDGYTFTQIYSTTDSQDIKFLALNPKDSNEITASFSNNSFIITKDGGQTWQQAGETDDAVVQLGYLPDSSKQYALLEDNGLSYYTGSEWIAEDLVYNEKGGDIRNTKQIYIYNSVSSSTDRTYLLIADEKLWIKKSGESIFEEVKIPLSSEENNITAVEAVYRKDGSQFSDIWVAVGSDLYRTSNQGVSWQANDQVGLTGDVGNISDIVIDEFDNDTYYLTLNKESKKSGFSLFG